MANVLSLALKINADSSGLKLDPVERALQRLGAETDKVTAIFDEFASTSEAAARAQEDTARSIQELTQARQQGTITAQEFADQFQAVKEAAEQEAQALQRAAQITEQNISPTQRYQNALAELDGQLAAGRITQETYDSALEKARQTLEGSAGSAEKNALQFNELSGIFAILPGPIGNVAGRISGLTSAGEGLSRVFEGGLTAGLSGIGSSLTALINPFTLAAAGAAAFGAAASAVVSGLVSLEDRVENLGNVAARLGTSFEFVQVLDESARRSGTSIDAVSAAFGRLQISLSGTDGPSKKVQGALEGIGLTAAELQALAPEDQYREIASRLAAIEDPAQRTALATELFGKAGASLLPFFNNLEGAERDLKRFGAAISDLDRGRVDALGTSFDGLAVALQGLGQNLILPFAGVVDGVVQVISSVIGQITTNFVQPFGELITPVLDRVGAAFAAFAEGVSFSVDFASGPLQRIGSLFQTVFDTIGNIISAAGPGIQTYFDALTSTVTRLITVFSDSFSAVFDALSELGAAFGRLLGFGDDVTQIGTRIGEAFGFVYTVFGQVVQVVGSVIEVFNRFATIVIVSITKALTVVTDLVSKFLEFTGIGSALQTLGGIISSVFGSVAGVFSTIANAIGGTVGRLLAMAERFLGIERTAKEATASTEQLAEAVDEAADSANELAEAQARAADEAQKRAEEAKKIADEEAKRVNDLLALQEPIDKLAQDITATNNEIIRTEAALAEARAAGAIDEANRLAARLAKLDQLQQSLLDKSDEAAQGFLEGFDKAFEGVDRGYSRIIDKASELGNEGAIAASQLLEGIEAAKAAVRDGILNKEAFEAEIARQNKLFEDRVKGLQEAAKITEQLYDKEAELLARQFEIEKQRAEELATIRTGSVQVNDFRSGGVSQFFDTLREDPAVGEARKQTAELQKQSAELQKQRAELERIRAELRNLNADKVDILQGTG
jgi:hypothetical protein